MQTNSELLISLPTDSRLAGQKAIVTGSSSGIGEAIARVLAASGAEVVVSGRDMARAQGVVDAIKQSGGKAYAVAADLAGSYADLRRFVQEATEALGGQVDILVNNAGVYPVMPIEALPDADLDAILATNIRAPHVLVGAIAPGMCWWGPLRRAWQSVVRAASSTSARGWAAWGRPTARCTPPPKRLLSR